MYGISFYVCNIYPHPHTNTYNHNNNNNLACYFEYNNKIGCILSYAEYSLVTMKSTLKLNES